jgi:hypothetical protein
LEYLTGGYIQAGYHEVVVTDATIEVINKKRLLGESLWRVSSTLFAHVATDKTLQPIGPFCNDETLAKYPPINTGEFVSTPTRITLNT